MCPNEPNFVGWVLAPLRVLADADPNELLIGVRAAARTLAARPCTTASLHNAGSVSACARASSSPGNRLADDLDRLRI